MLDYSFFYMYIFMIKPLSLESVFFAKRDIAFLYQNSILLENLRGFILNQSIPEQLHVIRSVEH